MRLSPAKFNQFLSGIGQDIAWRQARDCPCIQPHTGSPDPSCLHCDGIGHLWAEPVVTVAGVVSRDLAREFAPMAPIESGDIMLVLPSNQACYAMAEFDRVVMLDNAERFSLGRVRGRSERFRFDPLTVDLVEWIDNDVVVSAVPDSFSRDGVVFATGGPPHGVSYSVSGTRRPEFYCYLNLPISRPHQRGDALPKRVVMRRIDLLGGGG